MIELILRNASQQQLFEARWQVAEWLHVNWREVPDKLAIAYICKHFEQGQYTGWDGWVAMREADAR